MILLLCESRLRTGKTQVTAKENPRAHSSPFCKAWVVAKKKSWQTRAFFAMASLRSTPGKRGTSAPRCKSSLLLSSEVKGWAVRQPLLHEIGHRQRKTTSTKFPRFVKPRSLPRKNPGKREPSSRWQACGPRRASEGRAPRDVKVLCFFLSRKKRRKKAARRGRPFFSRLPFLSTQTPGRSGRPG